MPTEALEYLISRGYNRDLAAEEDITFCPKGEHSQNGVDFRLENDSLLFPVRSMRDQLCAIHSAGTQTKDYRLFYVPTRLFLPPLYGSAQDRDTLYRTKELILTEGVFDRRAIKNAFPQRAVFARLTKGVSTNLVHLLQWWGHKTWLAFDTDEPGKDGAEKAEKRLTTRDQEATCLHFPAKDPNDLWKRKGTQGVRKALEKQLERL